MALRHVRVTRLAYPAEDQGNKHFLYGFYASRKPQPTWDENRLEDGACIDAEARVIPRARQATTSLSLSSTLAVHEVALAERKADGNDRLTPCGA